MKPAIMADMKSVACLVMLLPAMAIGTAVGPLPPSGCADTEASTNLPLRVELADMSRIEFALSLVATPSNSVEVAVGTDANADGVLSPDEADQAFGWNCGRWFRRDGVRDAELVEESGAAPVEHGSRVEKTFVLRRRELDPAWNMVRVVRRGPAVVGEVALVEGKRPGVLLMVR